MCTVKRCRLSIKKEKWYKNIKLIMSYAGSREVTFVRYNS